MTSSAYPTVKERAGRAGQHEPLYVTEHSVAPDFDFPEGSRLEKLPGLLFCQIVVRNVEGKEERRVVAWWKSQETFARAWEKQFGQLLGPESELCFEGFQLVHSVRRDRLRWLRPAFMVTAVGTLVALLTGLSTVQDYGYSLLAIPNCTLWTDPVAAAKPQTVGEPFAIQVQVKNRHLRAPITATISPVIQEGLTRLDETKPYRIRVEPGKAETQEFRFVAPNGGGRYAIHFGGTQEGGVFTNPPREIPGLDITIDVWDPIDQHPKLSLGKTTDRNATVFVEVRNAKPTPYGTSFEATLTNPRSVDIRPDKRSIKEAEDPLRNEDFAQLRWRVPPSTDALKVETFRLMLEETSNQPRKKDEWSELLKGLTVRADETEESSLPTPIKK